jgi:hypothetical protein
MMADKTLTLVKSRQKGRSRFAWLRQFYQNFTQVTDEQVIATLVRFPPNVPTVKTNPAASTIGRIHRRNAPRGNMPNAARARLRTNPARPTASLEISSNATAILCVSVAVMRAQIFFLAQDLTVQQPSGRAQVNQTYPIWEDQEFSDQDKRKGHINGIATEGKNTIRYQFVGIVSVNADSKALPEGNQTPQDQRQPRQANQHAGPRACVGVEELARDHSRPIERGGEQDIEIEQGKWRDQEIRLIYTTEFHHFYPLSSQNGDSGQKHPNQKNDC